MPVLPALEEFYQSVSDKIEWESPPQFPSQWLSSLPILKTCAINRFDSEHEYLGNVIISSLCGLRDLDNLESLELCSCEFTPLPPLATIAIAKTSFLLLRKLKLEDCSGNINFARLDLPSLESLQISYKTHKLNFEIPPTDETEDTSEDAYFDFSELGRHCPNLKKFSLFQYIRQPTFSLKFPATL